ncbi:MAG: YbhB/YbcL family Raf kinase inhibitor-like protein, partial [Myxococcales bacterium]
MTHLQAVAWLSAGLALLLGLSGCEEGRGSEMKPGDDFTLTSSAFADKGHIPAAYGCGKERNWRKPSVPLTWAKAPQGTKSFVLLMDDPDPVARYWVHWLVVDVPAETMALAKGASGAAMPAGARELTNSFGEAGYGVVPVE